MTDDYLFWRNSLEWRADPGGVKMPDFDPRKPEVGFYRGQRNEAIAIWRKDGATFAKVTSRRPDGQISIATYDREDIIGDSVFSFCCRHPIEHDAYSSFIKETRWPEQIENIADLEKRNRSETSANDSGTPGLGDNLPKSPEGSIEAELSDLLDRANAFVKSIDAKIEDQTTADKVANYGIAVAEIEKRAEQARESEKRPFLEEGRKVDAKWNRIIERAGKAKANLKSMLTSWLSRKRREQEDRHAREEQERRAARTAGETPDLRRAEPSESVAGTQGGRISLRTRTLYEITDIKALTTFLASLNQPPADWAEASRKAGEKLMKAGMQVPGMSARGEEYSA
jgi:hypothetical protein